MNSKLIAQFKRLREKQLEHLEQSELLPAIQGQLSQLGTVVFSLVGNIGEASVAEINVDAGAISILRYDPQQSSEAQLSGNALTLSQIDNLDNAWTNSEKAMVAQSLDPKALKQEFEKDLQDLQEATKRPIDLRSVKGETSSILKRIESNMGSQIKEFDIALGKLQGDPADRDAYYELLRIAYNFADSTIALLSLASGICDLKPIVQWLTVGKQNALSDAFASLPFNLVGQKKPSPKEYRAVIASARNRAFHSIFDFDHPMMVTLPNNALGQPQLNLFRAYGLKTSALTFDDQKVVELFASLTRTPERPVPEDFWVANQSVMKSALSVVEQLDRALVGLWK
ncbi:MAG: hypothetical protein WA359_06295 [Acidimicrobiales bacterium]